MNAAPHRIDLVVANAVAALPEVMRSLERFLGDHGVGERTTYAAELIVDEIFSNVVRHAFPDAGRHDIAIAAELSDRHLVLTFEDDGVPFDPREAPERAPVAPDDIAIGGLGLGLVKKYAETMAYERRGGRNRLAVHLTRG